MLPHLLRRLPSSSSSSQRLKLSTSSRTHIIFGANTDVGKTVVTAGLIRASGDGTNYIKPLQCGGSDQRFIEKHAPDASSTTTLYEWVTPASPHYAARFENKPVSDVQVLTSLQQYMASLDGNLNWIETAGGVLSPSSSSPENRQPHHARDKELSWGWVTQADLYRPLIGSTSVVLIGDGRLGGISATLTALESLLIRGYDVSGVILIEKGYENQQAVQEYVSRESERSGSNSAIFRNPQASIVSLPELPPEPEPLTDWYNMDEVRTKLGSFVQDHLTQAWKDRESKE